MQTRAEIIAVSGSIVLMLMLLELVRRRKLKEKYSLLWLFTALVLLVLSLSKGLLDKLAVLMGIYYSPSAFFLLAFMFMMLIMVQFSIVISRLSERNKTLAQELALLRLEMGKLKAGAEPGGHEEKT